MKVGNEDSGFHRRFGRASAHVDIRDLVFDGILLGFGALEGVKLNRCCKLRRLKGQTKRSGELRRKLRITSACLNSRGILDSFYLAGGPLELVVGTLSAPEHKTHSSLTSILKLEISNTIAVFYWSQNSLNSRTAPDSVNEPMTASADLPSHICLARRPPTRFWGGRWTRSG